MHKSNDYRTDIDGLRALAVLSVILFHISHSILPGGFVGVDIFYLGLPYFSKLVYRNFRKALLFDKFLLPSH
jgi:hypothetical protein